MSKTLDRIEKAVQQEKQRIDQQLDEVDGALRELRGLSESVASNRVFASKLNLADEDDAKQLEKFAENVSVLRRVTRALSGLCDLPKQKKPSVPGNAAKEQPEGGDELEEEEEEEEEESKPKAKSKAKAG